MTCDLRGYMNQSPLNEIQIKRFLHQILSGIAYCHSKKVFHRDLKPHNILIGEDGNIKIADFGLARTFSVPEKAYSLGVVTQFYRPPEILLGSAFYGPQIDIWSIGCIFAEMSTNRPLF
jgi:serine/threonine protein kinase